jgi:hypothetical protein
VYVPVPVPIVVLLLVPVGIIPDGTPPLPVGLMVEVTLTVSVTVVTPPGMVVLTVTVRKSVAPIVRVYSRQQQKIIGSDRYLQLQVLWMSKRW